MATNFSKKTWLYLHCLDEFRELQCILWLFIIVASCLIYQYIWNVLLNWVSQLEQIQSFIKSQ